MLEKLSLSSRSYRMERLTGQFAGNESSTGLTTLELDWQEQVTVHYRITPLDRQGSSCLLSDCPFAEEKSTSGECILSSEADYLCLEKASERFEVSWRGVGFGDVFVFVGWASHFVSLCEFNVRT